MSRSFSFLNLQYIEEISKLRYNNDTNVFLEDIHMEMAFIVSFIIGLILNIISMIACPIIAGNKGRSVAGWFFGGFFLSVIGLIIVSCLPEIPFRR